MTVKEGRGDLELWRRIEAQVQSTSADEGSLLDGPAVEHFSDLLGHALGGTPAALPLAGTKLGQRIGPYQLMSVLGSGGMGTVFLASRADGSFDRSVALKVLHRSPSDEDARRRFQRERQILADLTHPHIARLLDGGVVDDGTIPYLVMEYVDGRSIIDHCEQAAIDPRGRIELVLQACDALHHAHRRGVVHRDVKPSNLLIETDDEGTPQLKVVDFGIALVDGAAPKVTVTGQVFGTPGYMSPEQALGLRGEVDRRTDVFALGVVLYELLSGERPFAGSAAEVPGHGGGGLAARQPPSGSADLATIVDTCLAREPEHRYDSALALSADLESYLDGRPIAARPVGAVERLWRRAQRHPAVASVLAAAVGISVVSLVLVTVISLRHAADLEVERNAAVEARRDAESLLDFMLTDLYDGLERAGRLDLLEAVARRSTDYFAENPPGTAEGEILARSAALFNAGEVMESRSDFAAASAAYGENLRTFEALVAADPDPKWQLQLARSEAALAGTRLGVGDAAAARSHIDAALAWTRRLQDRGIRSDAWALRHFEALALAGWTARELAETDLALDLMDEARDLATARVSTPAGAAEPSWRHRLAVARGYAGLVHYERGELESAVESFVAAGELCQDLVAEDPTNTVWRAELQLTLGRLAGAQLDLEEVAGAETSLRSAQEHAKRLVELAPDNSRWRRELAVSHSMLAEVASSRGDVAAALGHMESSLGITRILARRFPDNPAAADDLAWDLLETGRLRRDAGDLDAARRAWRESLEVMDGAGAATSVDLYVLLTRAKVLIELGRLEEAQPLVDQLLGTEWSDPDFVELCAAHGLIAGPPDES